MSNYKRQLSKTNHESQVYSYGYIYTDEYNRTFKTTDKSIITKDSNQKINELSKLILLRENKDILKGE